MHGRLYRRERSGKSTTLKSILGLIHPDSGEIEIFGKNIKEHEPALMNRIGVVFDDINIPGEMKIKEVCKFCRLSFDTWEENTFNQYINRQVSAWVVAGLVYIVAIFALIVSQNIGIAIIKAKEY